MDCDPCAACSASSPVQMTDHASSDTIPNWSADGSPLYFASQRSGEWQIWKTPARGNRGEAVQMTTQGGFFAAESADGPGSTIRESTRPQVMGVWRKPLRGKAIRHFGQMIRVK